MFEEKIKGITERTELVILPEMFSTGFSMNPELLAEDMTGPTVSWMKSISANKKIILTGSVIIKEEGKYFNRLLWVLPNGAVGHYDKRHLFCFANEHLHYSAGKKRFIASVKGWKINLMVCYDLRFPVWARQQNNEEPEYDLLVYVANWPDKRNHAWKTLLNARAIENQSYVIGVNRVGKDANEIVYSGASMISGPLGEIIYLKENEEDVFTFTLQKKALHEAREKFPFLRDADGFRILN
jgi:predicted amidohydrolase